MRLGGSGDPEIAAFASSGMGGRDTREFFERAGGNRDDGRSSATTPTRGHRLPTRGNDDYEDAGTVGFEGGVRLHRHAVVEISTLPRRPERESHREAAFQRHGNRGSVAQTIARGRLPRPRGQADEVISLSGGSNPDQEGRGMKASGLPEDSVAAAWDFMVLPVSR